MTSLRFCAILFPVSERKTMNLFKKNQMTLKEIERFMDAKRKREASLDHRGRSNDDCPLIVGLQNKIKELENKG